MTRQPVMLIPILCLGGLVNAAEPAPATDPLLLGGNEFGDDLSQFTELPVVVSASRGRRPLEESSVPVSVVRGDDLRLAGYTSVAEALFFVPGVDVLMADRNHYMVGVRGMHEIFSDRTLTLVDGVIADNPVYGGSEFQRLPIQMDAIDHIEVVRGPAGAAWGANALNGMINIITANPEDRLGTHATAQTNQFGDVASEIRWGDFAGPVSWRLDLGYEKLVSSDDAIDDPDASDLDDSQSVRASGRLHYRWTPSTTLELSLGGSHVERGAIENLGSTSTTDARFDMGRGSLSLRQQVDEHASFTVSGYSNVMRSEELTLQDSTARELGTDLQVDLMLPARHEVTIGAGMRTTHVATLDSNGGEQFTLTEDPLRESRVGIYAIDHWHIVPALTMETQGRADHYSGTGSDWAGRMALLWSLDGDGNHVLRLAGARAYRTPLSGLRQTEADRLVVPPGIPLITYRTHDLDNEHTWSLEAGITSRPAEGVTLRLDGYFQAYHDLIGYETSNPTPPMSITAETLGDGEALGAEAEAAFANTAGRWSMWYAINHFETDYDDQSIRAYRPAEHKIGFTSRWNLPHRMTGIVNARWTDETESEIGNDPIEAWTRIDVALSWRWTGTPLTLAAGCHDLLDDTPESKSLGGFVVNAMPGRTFFLRGEATF